MFARRVSTVFVTVAVAVAACVFVPHVLLAQKKGATPQCVTGCGGGTYGVTVSPQGGAATAPVNSSNHTVSFTVTNIGTNSDTYTFSCSDTGGITCESVSPTSATLAGNTGSSPSQIQPLCIRNCGGGGNSTTVTVTYNIGGTGGNVDLTASGNASSEGWYTVTASGPPVVDASPSTYDLQDFGRCALSCFAATYSQSTVPYFSLDTPRQVTLVYNGARVNPHPFVLVNVEPDPNYGSWPTQFEMSVKINGALVQFLNGEDTLHFAYAGTSWHRMGGQFDASGDSTGEYSMEIDVAAVYSGAVITTSITKPFVVVKENSSPIARGWSLAGIQRLYVQTDSSAIIAEGDGSSLYFAHSGSSWNRPAGDFTTLVAHQPNGSSGWTRLSADSTKIVFNSAGYMTEVIDRFGTTETIQYDGSNRVQKIVDPTGRSLTLAYGSYGLASVTDPGGRVTYVTVDGSHRLTAIKDPDNISTSFGYDGSLRLQTITNRAGASTTLYYDPQAGTVDSVQAPSVALYSGSGAPTTRFGSWQRVSVPYAATRTTPETMAPTDITRAKVTEPGGAVTYFTVNAWGAAAQTTDALGHVTTTTFDANGLPTQTVYPDSAVDKAQYNADGLPTWTQTADATDIRYIQYGGWAQPDSAWGGVKPSMHASLGANGRVDWVRTGGDTADVERFSYDAYGRVVADTAPGHFVIMKHWYGGSLNNVTTDSVPGHLVGHYYDQFGRDTATQMTALPTTRTHFDVMNQTIKTYAGPSAAPVVMTYDSTGHVTSVTDPKGQVYSFAYNKLGWMTTRTDSASETLKYDLDGDLMRVVNRRGETISYAYDALHRRISKSGANTETWQWTYSSNNRVLTAISPLDTDSTYLNVRGQPVSVKTSLGNQTYSLIYRYDTHDRLDTLSGSGGGETFWTRVYSYDPKTFAFDTVALTPPAQGTQKTALGGAPNILADVTHFPNGDSVVSQYTHGYLLGSTIAGGSYSATVNHMESYDDAGRLIEKVNADTMSGREYTYDGRSRVTSDSGITAPNPPPGCDTQIFGDNGTDCLSGYFWSTTGGSAFSYDSAGNRTDQSHGYGSHNRIASFAGCSYTTDADGNVTSRKCGSDSTTFKWTADGLLDTVIASGRTIGYHYDASGRLIQRDTNGVAANRYIWNGASLLAEFNGTGTVKVGEYSYYLRGLDQLHAFLYQGQEYDAHQDALGNVIALTHGTQTSRSYVYDTWGSLTSGNDAVGFNGADLARWKGALDIGTEAGLYYMRARWYEPQTGRFLSEDPQGLGASLNLYTFGDDDPIDTHDPSGMDPDVCEDGATAVKIVQIAGVSYMECEGKDGKIVQKIPMSNYHGYLPNSDQLNDPTKWTPFYEAINTLRNMKSAADLQFAKTSSLASFLYCTEAPGMGRMALETGLDAVAIAPGGNDLASTIKLGAGVASTILALRDNSPGPAAAGVSGLGIDLANHSLKPVEDPALATGASEAATEAIPWVGNAMGLVATGADVREMQGAVKSCMAGIN